MINQDLRSRTIPKTFGHLWTGLHRLTLIVIWLVSTTALITMLLLDVRDTGRYSEVRYILQAGYVAALLWYLSRSGPPVSQLPELRPLVFPRWRYGVWIPVTIIAIIFTLTALSDGDLGLLVVLVIAATWSILIPWRRQIRFRSVIQGLALALVVYLAGLPMFNNGFVSATAFYGLLINVPPMYIAGGLLVNRTSLGGVQLSAKHYRKSLLSSLWGCLLFVPLGLFNAVSGSPGSNISWVSEWWLPFSLPWFSAISEETWFRLFLVGLCYFLLRPAFPRHPVVAITIAVLFSAITFGLGHNGTYLERFLVTGLLYGLPMAVVFARRDWEHAVGAHYMVNLIPWIAVFLET